jgi:hypothetical protein
VGVDEFVPIVEFEGVLAVEEASFFNVDEVSVADNTDLISEENPRIVLENEPAETSVILLTFLRKSRERATSRRFFTSVIVNY